jgi:hypothetical protein
VEKGNLGLSFPWLWGESHLMQADMAEEGMIFINRSLVTKKYNSGGL